MISLSQATNSVPISLEHQDSKHPPSTPPSYASAMPLPSRPSRQPSPASSDDSNIFENVSFVFDYNDPAAIRFSKGSGVSTPPSSSSEYPSPIHTDESPAPASRRSSLSRSESAPSVVEPPRQFQRVASQPVHFPAIHASTPAASSARLPVSTGLSSTSRKFGGARRVKIEEARESNERARAEIDEFRQLPQRASSAQGRQMLPVPRSSRLGKRVEPIAETEDEDNGLRSHAYLSASGPTRPRRSASLSEAHPDDGLPQLQQFPRQASSRNAGARRVTFEEKLKQERQIGTYVIDAPDLIFIAL
ncbi:hypothetical protein K474DRAFT_1454520 [Panus rudis PR-1116 ss-1]|nr:hypothetical protein K474DRAFT_1454520 [Panus rudis PR-1116 ss-1]